MTPNFRKVFSVFRKNYVPIPLEVFKKDPYKILVSTVLSSRTKDEITLLAANRLFKKAPNFKKLSKLNQPEIRNLIFPVGFYKIKTKHLKLLTEKVINDFGGKVPQTLDKLISLPGVGRKTANLVLNRAFKIPAIAVDTHVHRISNLLGWVKTNTPQQTEENLTNILPRKYWSDVNKLFVSIGRQFTTKRGLENFLKKERLLNNPHP